MRMLAGLVWLLIGALAVGAEPLPRTVVFHTWPRSGRVEVMDFGITRASQYTTLTQAGQGMGTPIFMAPEQFDAHTVDERSDQYSLGVIAWRLLTGRTPYDEEATSVAILKSVIEPIKPVIDVVPDVSQALNAVVMRMVEKEPERRFGSLTDVQAALTAAGFPPP